MINKISSPSVVPQSSFVQEKKPSTAEQRVPTETAADTGSVKLSGHALMLSRLFGQDEAGYTGEVMTDRNSSTGALVPYLTGEDRAMLEKMYDYSVANSIDLRHVDALGGDLAFYRRFGTSSGAHDLFDAEGHALTFAFSQSDKAHAERIAENSATSTIDRGFLQSELVVGGRGANFSFLERMTEVFSAQPKDIPRANQAPIAAYNAEANKLVATASSDVQLVIPEADYSSINGVGHWRTPELEAAHNAKFGMHQGGGAISDLLAAGDANTRGFLTLLDGYAQHNGISRNELNSVIDLLHSDAVAKLWPEVAGQKQHDQVK